MFKVLFGEEKNVSKHVVLGTTMWVNLNGPGLSEAVGAEREDELLRTKEWWGMMRKRGSRVYRYTDTSYDHYLGPNRASNNSRP